MHAKAQSYPFLLFWVGLLTGALLIGLLFLYRIYGEELGANLLRTKVYPTTSATLQSTDLRSVGNPPTFMPQGTVEVGNPPTF